MTELCHNDLMNIDNKLFLLLILVQANTSIHCLASNNISSHWPFCRKLKLNVTFLTYNSKVFHRPYLYDKIFPNIKLIQRYSTDDKLRWTSHNSDTGLGYWMAFAIYWMTSTNINISALLALSPPVTTKVSDVELWDFLWSAPEQTLEQTIESLVRRHRVHYDVTVMNS